MAISKVSFTKTPQAGDDYYYWDEDALQLDPNVYDTDTGYLTLDVMANDLGGAAKTLYSIDDGNGNPLDPSDLLSADALINGISDWQQTESGNQARINNGKIEFDLSFELPDGVNSLAEGEQFTDTFIYAIRLGNGTLSWAHVHIEINGVNDAPVSTDDSVTTSEDAVIVLGLSDFGTFSDVDGDALAAVKITSLATNGVLEYDTVGDGTGWTAVTLNQEISAADITAGQLRFVPDANENGTPYADIGFQVSDGIEFSVDEYTLTVNVTAVNDAPVNTIAAQSATEDTPSAITGLQVSDVDAGSADITVTLSVASGALTVRDDVVGGLAFGDIAGNGTASVTLTGSQAEINLTLAALLGNDTDVENDLMTVVAISTDGGATWVEDDNNDGIIISDNVTVDLNTNTVTYVTGDVAVDTDSTFLYRVADANDNTLYDEGEVKVTTIPIGTGQTVDTINLDLTPYFADSSSYSYIDTSGGDDNVTGTQTTVTFIGGQGNDTLNVGIFDADDKVDGGANTTNLAGTNFGDILIFDGALDLTAVGVSERIVDIETLRMTDLGGGDSLTLNAQDVIDLGSGTFNPFGTALQQEDAIRVDGDAGDALNLTGGGWSLGVPAVSGNGDAVPAGYVLYVHDGGVAAGIQADAYVLVQSGVNVAMS